MKKRSFLTRTDLERSNFLKRTKSDFSWKRNDKSSGVHSFKGDQEPHDKCLNVYQQLTRSYSWLKQNVFHSPDAESIVISNKKIKHVLKEFNNKNFQIVQNLTMADEAAPSQITEEAEQKDSDFIQPESAVKPEEARKQSDTSKSAEDSKSAEATKPAETSKPAEVSKPAEPSKPAEVSKPAEPNKPAEASKPAEVNKPVKDGKKTDASKPPDSSKPESANKLADASKPEDTSKSKTKGDEEKKVKLLEADARAKNMAQFITEMKASLAEYAKKDNMTEEDAKEMLKKQEELMAKLSEFEELTKNIQNMAGIENVSSSLLGIPTQCREVNPCGPTHFDNFPKVICFDRISQHELGIPNMIVCEPVCKENKNPCEDAKQQGRAYPTPDHMKRGFIPDCDAERYIQKDLSREMHSTEVIGMLDRQGMLVQPYQNAMRSNTPMMQPQPQTYPVMLKPQKGAPQHAMMAQQGRPGGFNHPWAVPGQQAWSAVQQPGGMMGPQPGGMVGPQQGMMGPQPGMMGFQSGMMGPQSGMMGPQSGMGASMGMLGAQGQMTMIPSKPLPGTMNTQASPQMYQTTNPQALPGMMQANVMQPPMMTNKTGKQTQPGKGKAKDYTEETSSVEQTGKPELTIKQQELFSKQTTTRIAGGNHMITERSETDRTEERSLEITTIDKLKADTERTSKRHSKTMPEDMLGSLKKQVDVLQAEMKGVIAENRDLQKRVLMCSPDATRQMLRSHTDAPVICRKTLATTPVCRLDLYRQLNLPLPSPLGIKPYNRGGAFPQPQLQLPYQQAPCVGKCQREFGNKIACRRNILKQLAPFSDEGATRDMETMVTSMEEEVKVLQAELNSVQEERRQLEMQKKLLTCTAPTIAGKGVGINSYPTHVDARGTQILPKVLKTDSRSSMATPLRDLKEQYNKLQQDYQLKVEEISMLRVELESARRESLASIEKSEVAEARVDELIARLKAVEDEKSKITSNKDQLMELEQQLVLAKQRYKEINEEIDELRSQIVDQTMQTDDYRKKFLSAQQTVEEQRRDIEMIEKESSKFGEQLTIELQKVKAQFHSKLEELAPLPEILRKTQDKLKETIHLKTLAEKNCLVLSQNLEITNEQKEKLREELEEINRNKSESEAEKASLKINLTDGEKKMEEIKAENNKLRSTVLRLEDLAKAAERKFEGKVQECLQLQSQLETLREESARQVSRTKDRYENMRKSLQNQIFELENQLAATRASAKAAQRDRDDIRQKMQAQIIQLNQNFDQAQMRIRSLQSHVNYLKTSYTNIFPPPDKTDSSIMLP